MMDIPEGKSLILFDGYCHLCSGLVRHILRRDSKAHFLFCSLDSKLGQSIRAAFQIPDSIDSIILIEHNKASVYADAVFQIAVDLGGIYQVLLIGRLIPKLWRDKIYCWIARNRYRWFGKRKSCMLPDGSLRSRFL